MSLRVSLAATARRLRTGIKAFAARKILRHGRDLHIGARTRLWAPRHIVLGDCVYIGKDVHIEANCRIGDFCLFANRVAIIGRHDHDFTAVGFPMRFAPWLASKRFPNRHATDEAVIEDDVWLGYGAIVLTGVTIGRGSVIAAGSVVAKDIPPYSIAAGTPARVVGRRFPSEDSIKAHETAIAQGRFALSERGYDFCLIEPASTRPSTNP